MKIICFKEIRCFCWMFITWMNSLKHTRHQTCIMPLMGARDCCKLRSKSCKHISFFQHWDNEFLASLLMHTNHMAHVILKSEHAACDFKLRSVELTGWFSSASSINHPIVAGTTAMHQGALSIDDFVRQWFVLKVEIIRSRINLVDRLKVHATNESHVCFELIT